MAAALPLYILCIMVCLLLLSACQTAPSIYEAPAIYPDRSRLPDEPPEHALWTPKQLEVIRSLWLGSLPEPPVELSSGVGASPAAAELGHHLFFDPRFSANQQVACATCHEPQLHFSDAQTTAHGTRAVGRNAQSLVGVAYNDLLLWDGRKDSLWSQALGPLESPDEHGTTRLHVVHLVTQDERYRTLYEAAFGSLPDFSDFSRFPDSGGPVEFEPYRINWDGMAAADQEMVTAVFVNVGKAIAAYERLLLPGVSRFDRYAEMILGGEVLPDAPMGGLSEDEEMGLATFIGEGDCIRCHSGPLFSDGRFHNTGVPLNEAVGEDNGRLDGIPQLLADPFNCSGMYNENGESACSHLQSLVAEARQFRTPPLRSASRTGPYMHAGQMADLTAVLRHYNHPPVAPSGQTDLIPLNLPDNELIYIVAFLESLEAPLITPEALLVPPER
ncbi:MAG: cytochrome c peroxidase [Chloroflexota bacterium]